MWNDLRASSLARKRSSQLSGGGREKWEVGTSPLTWWWVPVWAPRAHLPGQPPGVEGTLKTQMTLRVSRTPENHWLASHGGHKPHRGTRHSSRHLTGREAMAGWARWAKCPKAGSQNRVPPSKTKMKDCIPERDTEAAKRAKRFHREKNTKSDTCS